LKDSASFSKFNELLSPVFTAMPLSCIEFIFHVINFLKLTISAGASLTMKVGGRIIWVQSNEWTEVGFYGD
jgi:hypothetical protein